MTTPQRTLPCQEAGPEVFCGPIDGPGDSEPGQQPHAWEWLAMEDYCWSCPVESPCLAQALSWPIEDQYGVVGGMTAGQRRAVLQRRGPAVEIPPGVDQLTVDHLVAGVIVPGASRIDVAHAAVRLHDTGMTCTEVALQLGVQANQVLHWTYRRRDGKPLIARTESAVAS